MLSDSPGADDKALGDVLRRLWGDGKNTMGLNQDGDGLPHEAAWTNLNQESTLSLHLI